MVRRQKRNFVGENKMSLYDELKNKAYNMLKTYKRGSNEYTHSEIVELAEQICSVGQFAKYKFFLVGQIVDEFEENMSIKGYLPEILSLSKSSEWFYKKKGTISTPYFDRYKKYLSDEENFAEDSIDKIAKTSEEILARCADPENATGKDKKKKGLVVGDVQSGKTANFLALINMACDYGYKIVIVLAGMSDVLRKQTQKRMDYGFIGAKSETICDDIVFAGVGKDDADYYAISLTNVNYDFNKLVKESNNANPDDYRKPVVMVIKKNKKVLNHVIEALKAKEEKLGRGNNVLIIDDEADNASINTKKNTDMPSTINACIRKIFNNFDIATYIGFTATPFANIFINPEEKSGEKNLDLFPSDFIIQLKHPDDYFGAEDVFNDDRVIRLISEDEEKFLPAKHKKYDHYEGLTESLKEAINCFVIDNALRTLDGFSSKHRSMLINISVFNPMQEEVGRCVKEYINDVINVFDQDSYKTTEQFIQNSIANNFYKTYMTDDFYCNKQANQCYSWDNVREHILPELKKIEVVVFNRTVQSTFDYDDPKYSDGARIIAVGGYVLSRGLTLEGLMISYYNRSSKTYDTMLQMCRWFGYRPKYKHLCRVYMTEDNKESFLAVLDAVSDLQEQFMRLRLRGAKPAEFGLYVKESPDSLATKLMITASGKMRNSYEYDKILDYAGVICDTSKIFDNYEYNSHNERAIHSLLSLESKKGKSLTKVDGRYIIKDVDKGDIAEFINKLYINPLNFKFDKDTILSYLVESEFEKWDIAIAEGTSIKKFIVDDNIEIKAGLRSFIVNKDDKVIRIGGSNNRIVDPGIFNAGLNEQEREDVKNIAKNYVAKGIRKNSTPIAKDYLSIKGRNPLLVIHPLDIKAKTDKAGNVISVASKEVEDRYEDSLVYAFSIGFPGVTSGVKMKYRGNMVNLCNEYYNKDEDEEEYDD